MIQTVKEIELHYVGAQSYFDIVDMTRATFDRVNLQDVIVSAIIDGCPDDITLFVRKAVDFSYPMEKQLACFQVDPNGKNTRTTQTRFTWPNHP